jgi:hypothetical protein
LAPLALFAPSQLAKAGCDPTACGRLTEDLVSGGAKIAWEVIQNPECSADIEENLLVAAAIVAIEQIPGSPPRKQPGSTWSGCKPTWRARR